MEIARILGDDVYDELDVTRSDYETLPAYEFYAKVERSCRELRPELVREVEKDLEAEGEEGNAPWQYFDSEKKAREFCREYAKGKYGLCLKIMDDVFWDDSRYRVNCAGSYREMREVYLNRCREEGRRSFLESLGEDRGKVLSGKITAGNMIAYAMWLGPRYCYQYCRKKGIMRYESGYYVIDSQF